MKYLEIVKATVNHVYWTLIMMAVLCLALAILLLLYPPLLVALVAAALVIFGTMLFVMAWKLNRLWRQVPEFLRK